MTTYVKIDFFHVVDSILADVTDTDHIVRRATEACDGLVPDETLMGLCFVSIMVEP